MAPCTTNTPIWDYATSGSTIRLPPLRGDLERKERLGQTVKPPSILGSGDSF